MLIFSPLEQFSVHTIVFFSKFTITFFSIYFLFYLLSHINYLSYIIDFFNNESNNNLYKYIYLIVTIWLFILFANLLGMIPYNSTITAQFILVISITIPLFIGINILGFLLHGFNIFFIIMPAGVPFALIPLIASLELFSYLIRILSLTLRLAANMIAGHILMKIILSVFILFPLLSVFILPLVILEFVVAFLQAYVYITLIISYFQDILIPH